MKGIAALVLVSLPWPCALQKCVTSTAESLGEQTTGGDLCTFLQLPLESGARKVQDVQVSKLGVSEEPEPSLLAEDVLNISGVPDPSLFAAGTVPGGGRILKVGLICALFVFCAFGLSDLFIFWRLFNASSAAQEEARDASSSIASAEPQPTHDAVSTSTASTLVRPRSLTSILGFTIIRLYTGFLSATWLPFLLAMEGQELWKENQSLFMGVSKLIYGMTILLNPILGLLGDRAVAVNHGLGRRLFVRGGVILSVIGIIICLKADHNQHFYIFMTGIMIWRLGDATVDVTAEVLVPELVPKSQYELAGGIKAAAFLLGALFGYSMLILFADVAFTWLYYAYLGGMLACAAPIILLLSDADTEAVGSNTEAPRRESEAAATQREVTFQGMMVQAYVAPAFVRGYLPLFCGASFLFGCGMAPMFFLLLMIRDIVGVSSPIALQAHFSACSMLFSVAAAISALLGAACEPAVAAVKEGIRVDAKLALSARLYRTACSALAFGAVIILLPAACMPERLSTRETLFYACSAAVGFVFGSGYAKFQEITWQLMPEDSEVAKASVMGFNVMCRIFGLGIGNFAAGIILDLFPVDSSPPVLQNGGQQRYQGTLWFEQAQPVYRPVGYVVMCLSCAIFCVASGMIVRSIAAGVRSESDRPRPAA